MNWLQNSKINLWKISGKKSNTILKKAKDILRASELELLNKDNKHVKENIKKSKHGKKLSPILLVRGTQKLIIADGYHRLCAIYYLSEDLEVPCRLI
jgi:disulfide oxidoreductase YuzD